MKRECMRSRFKLLEKHHHDYTYVLGLMIGLWLSWWNSYSYAVMAIPEGKY